LGCSICQIGTVPPVPREQEMIDSLKRWGHLTEEQIEFAESDEPKTVEKLKGWVKNLFLQKSLCICCIWENLRAGNILIMYMTIDFILSSRRISMFF
jgi:hypothetical protein